MDFTPPGTDTCFRVGPMAVARHKDGFREPSCCSNGSVSGGRMFRELTKARSRQDVILREFAENSATNEL